MAFTKWISSGFFLMALANSLLLDVEVGFTQPVSFTSAGNFGAGDGARAVVVGDFNGDGHLDLAVGIGIAATFLFF